MSSLPPDLFAALRSLDLPSGDFVIFGSGPLIIRGIIEATNDLDIVSRGAAWDKARSKGEKLILSDGAHLASFFDGAITGGATWKYGSFDIDELIDSAEMIDGLPFAPLVCVVEYKRNADRPKDREHLRLMEAAGLIPDPW